MTLTIAQHFAKFACENYFENLPKAVVDRTKLYILDTLGAIQAGVNETSTKIIADVVLFPSSRANCTVIGQKNQATALAAAMVNGAAAHAVEIDDDHRESALHPGAVIVPAALAACEDANTDGCSFITAVAAGYEVAIRVGMAMGGTQDRVGFHSTSTCGVFGAAVAAGLAYGLDEKQIAVALGLAGSQACGLQEWKADGSWTKRMHAGKAAEAGILSALMAQKGYSAPNTIFEGNYGFLKAFSGVEKNYPEKMTKDLGTRFEGCQTAFKPYACCRFSHQMIDAVRDLKKEHSLNPDSIERIDVNIYRTGFRALFEPKDRTYRPQTVVDAQFSIPYIIAITLLFDTVLPHHFTNTLIADNKVLAIMDRVYGQADDSFEALFPQKYGTEIKLTLSGGTLIETYADVPSGDPAKEKYQKFPQLFGQEIIEKYHALLEHSILPSQLTNDVVAHVLALEGAKDLHALARLLQHSV